MDPINPKIYGLVLGKVVASLRTKQGISQDAFAVRVGVSQPTISRIERGQVLPDALTFRRIASALGMTETELNQRVDQAIARTQKMAQAVLPLSQGKKNSSDPWKEILGIVGLAALAGLVVFAVAAIVDEIDRSRTRGQSDDL